MHWYHLAPWGFPGVPRRLPVCLGPVSVSASSASSGRCRAGSSCDLGRNTCARLSGIGTQPGVCGRSARNSAAWRPRHSSVLGRRLAGRLTPSEGAHMSHIPAPAPLPSRSHIPAGCPCGRHRPGMRRSGPSRAALRLRRVDSPEEAERRRFLGSPTVPARWSRRGAVRSTAHRLWVDVSALRDARGAVRQMPPTASCSTRWPGPAADDESQSL